MLFSGKPFPRTHSSNVRRLLHPGCSCASSPPLLGSFRISFLSTVSDWMRLNIPQEHALLARILWNRKLSSVGADKNNVSLYLCTNLEDPPAKCVTLRSPYTRMHTIGDAKKRRSSDKTNIFNLHPTEIDMRVGSPNVIRQIRWTNPRMLVCAIDVSSLLQ